ncbi:MAG: hypothetical protein M1339_02520 [Bacteroidetes bacterium]|nr:hypothetical protein [Bacteroidota bacterium]
MSHLKLHRRDPTSVPYAALLTLQNSRRGHLTPPTTAWKCLSTGRISRTADYFRYTILFDIEPFSVWS